MPDNSACSSIAIVVSEYNKTITGALYQGATEVLASHQHVVPDDLVVNVPGAVEIPIAAQWMARRDDVVAVITLGAVIRGDSDHYDYVAQQVSSGCQQVALKHNKPVIFGLLTTHNEEQALARIGGECGHYGKEAALTALSMIHLAKTVCQGKGKAHVTA